MEMGKLVLINIKYRLKKKPKPEGALLGTSDFFLWIQCYIVENTKCSKFLIFKCKKANSKNSPELTLVYTEMPGKKKDIKIQFFIKVQSNRNNTNC